ncbi:MAG: putative nucleic acid-binding proteincontains domain [Phycisphaerales bacterium]|nr:putative nucleic acid-binding proteincontains domain [Phycisphaerales bacterium]
MIVADANLIAYFVIPGERTKEAERVRAKDKDWVVPSVFPHELCNVLGNYIRRAGMPRDRAVRLYRRGLPVATVRHLAADPADVLRMVEQSGCSTYDLEYVWLAMKLGVRLVTTDKEVLDAYPDVAIRMGEFA